MADLKLEELKTVSPKLIGRANFYHFRGGAFLKLNDLMFRNRLMQSSWRFRKQVLTLIRSFLASGKQFDTVAMDLDTASLKRDSLLLFGGAGAIQTQLALESVSLPPNQKPNFHERYALITELGKLQLDGQSIVNTLELSPQDAVAMHLNSMYDHIGRNTPKVTDTWIWWSLSDGDKELAKFVATKSSAAKLYEEVLQAISIEEREEELPASHIGYRALAILGKDPLLDDPKNKIHEEELVSFILERMEPSESPMAKDRLESLHELIRGEVTEDLE